MAMQTVVKLGGREYTIRQKSKEGTRLWREKFRQSLAMQVFRVLDNVVETVSELAQGYANGSLTNADYVQVFKTVGVVPAIARGLDNSPDEVWALLYEYSPEIASDNDWLDKHAFDSEASIAFIEVLKHNYPFLAIWEAVTGRKAPGTTQNSPSPNGVSGLSPMGPKRKSKIS